MKPYMEDGYMVHANVTLPGGFKSRVASKQTPKGVKFYHVIQDELTTLDARDSRAKYRVVNSKVHGVYRMYESYSASDFDGYMKAHRSAVDMWMALWMTEGIGTVAHAEAVYDDNHKAMMDRMEA